MKKSSSMNCRNKKSRNIISRNTILCLLPVLIIPLFRILHFYEENDARPLMSLCLGLIAVYGLYLAYKGELTAGRAVFLIIIAGIIVRSGYTAYTHVFVRQHDIGANDETGVGHWGYLYHVINGHLPPSNEYQFYHPPFYYMVTAAAIKLVMLFKPGADWSQYAYVSQIVSCTASCIALVYAEKIMDVLGMDKKYQIPAISLIAFYPAHILTAGRFNNDSLSLMFMVLALYFTLCWHKNGGMKYIIYMALAIGFGMMTKINVAIIAFVAGPVMLYHLYTCIKSGDAKRIKNIIFQFAVFAIICFPCGLWYPIRNYILFDQPLNYVHELGKGSFVYTGDASWILRWVKFPLLNFMNVPYMNMDNDTNVFMALIKTGVHGEFSYDELSSYFAGGYDYIHFILLLFSAFAIGFVMIKYKDMDRTGKYGSFLVWLVVGVSYVQFNINYPFSCTADFRYVLLGQMAAALFISYFMEYTAGRREIKAYRYMNGFSMFLCAVFCIMGIMHFC